MPTRKLGELCDAMTVVPLLKAGSLGSLSGRQGKS